MSNTDELSSVKTTEFHYCFWAKLLVAIPALPLVGVIAASPFSNPAAQLIAAGVAIGLAVFLAVKIDQVPALMCKVVKR